ncbi:hypothetical protein RB595_009549 [Gaeumannomyces hyphopodioides]
MEPAQDITAIDADNFWALLPSVLEEIAAAEHIGLDLEMTGIRLRDGISGRREKLTAEQCYAAAVEAATAFQILEVGITCLRYGPESKSYHWKSYNFQLAPWYLGNEASNLALAKVLDRRFSLSGNTVSFLRASRGDDLPVRVLSKGITYLSRQEAQDAYDNFVDPDARNTPSININEESLAVRDFCAGVRRQITDWLAARERGEYFINIDNPEGDRLTSLQIRLIYQLLETDFKGKGLRGNPKGDCSFMQITIKGTDVYQEKALSRQRRDRKLAVRHQTGFRYVFEALVGGDFAEEIDVQLLLGSGAHSQDAIDDMKRKLRSVEKMTKTRARVLILHNSLFDLCFLYRSFVGDLPQSLTQFKLDLQVFPRLVDTKFMATRGSHELGPDMSLGQLYGTVENLELPLIAPPMSPIKIAHQAGYDSWITAVAFLKLSWKLGRDRQRLKT